METTYLDLSFRASQVEAVCIDANLHRAIEAIHDKCKHQFLHNGQIAENYLTTLEVLVEVAEERYQTK